MSDGVCSAHGQFRPRDFAEPFQAIARKHAGADGCLDTKQENLAAAREIMQQLVRGINAAHQGMPRKPGLSQVNAERVSLLDGDGVAVDVRVVEQRLPEGKWAHGRKYSMLQFQSRAGGAMQVVSLQSYQNLGPVVQVATNGRDLFVRFRDACDVMVRVTDRTGMWRAERLEDTFCLMGFSHRAYFDISRLDAAKLEAGVLYLFSFLHTGKHNGTVRYVRPGE